MCRFKKITYRAKALHPTPSFEFPVAGHPACMRIALLADPQYAVFSGALIKERMGAWLVLSIVQYVVSAIMNLHHL